MAYEVVVNGVTKIMSESEYRATEIDTISSVRVVPINDTIQYSSLDLNI